MKEVLSTARNITLVVDGNHVLPVVEAVITVTEPHFRADGSGNIERFRVPETLRFSSAPDGLRVIAKSMERWADEADEAAKKAVAGELQLPEKEPTDQ